jgi:4Fe-4S single cluster domain
MSEPIKCFYFDHAYDQQSSGPCCYLKIDGVGNFKDLHQHYTYLKIKQNFEQGQWTDNYCNECKNLELGHNSSKRQSAMRFYEKYKITDADVDKLYDLTIDAGRYCNIQCRSCSPKHSSSWFPEMAHMIKNNIGAPASTLHPHARAWYETKKVTPVVPYDQSDDMSNLKVLSIIGGEPLYNAVTFSSLQKILDINGPECQIVISTNATVSYKTIGILKEFKEVILILSIDAIGKAAEFIRTGCTWESVAQNIIDYQQLPNLHLTYHPAYSVMNLFEFVKMKEWTSKLNIFETSEISVVFHPKYLNYCVLNDDEKIKVLKYLNENNLDFVASQVENSVHDPEERKRFFGFMEHTKSYHNMDWREYLPELYQLMGDN